MKWIKKENLKLSIIVPIYNVEAYLPRCIESILKQTFTDFELILVDDGSPDGCGKIIEEYAEHDGRIVTIHQANQGVSAARNAGLHISQGAYIGFVDPDDWIAPEMYEALIRYLEQNDADISTCGINYFTEEGQYINSGLIGDRLYKNEEIIRTLYGMPNPIGGGCVNKLFKRDKICDVWFDANISMAEDWVFLFRCFEKCTVLYQGPDVLYNVTERSESSTRKDVVAAYSDILFGGKSLLLLLLARSHSFELEKAAIDKYMDDCIRYSVIIKKAARQQSIPYKGIIWRIRASVLRLFPRVLSRRMLPARRMVRFLIFVATGY